VLLLVCEPVPAEMMDYILWGLEEEGIPAEIQNQRQGSARQLGKRAAMNSRLNVGIGLDGPAKSAVLHHRDLPDDEPLFEYGAKEFNILTLRRLGANAARLAKGDPLLLEDACDHPKRTVEPVSLQPDEIEAVVSRIVKEVLKQDDRWPK